jgi:hypothetical protein
VCAKTRHENSSDVVKIDNTFLPVKLHPFIQTHQAVIISFGCPHIQNTLIYTQLDFGNGKYSVRVTHNVEEDEQLIEAGFEYVTGRDNYKICRQRK